MKETEKLIKEHPTLSSQALLPGDPDYADAASVWNARLNAGPVAVIRCAHAEDVAAAINLARDNNIALAVRGGGHSYAGFGTVENGLLLDLSPMKDVEIDRLGKRARVEPGVTWQEFDEKAVAAGMATTGGTVSSVGVAGFTLGGGSGYLARKHGLAIDNLLSVELVTASGEFVRAGETENPDLFWAVRGGGGNFGVVTRFEFQLHDIPEEVFAGQIIYPHKDAEAVLRAWRGVMKDAPDGFTCFPCVLKIPPIPAFPEEIHGDVVIDLVFAWIGDEKEGRSIIEPLRGIADPILDMAAMQPYAKVQQALDAGVPRGLRWYSQAEYMNEVTDEAITAFHHNTAELPAPLSLVYFEPLGGAVSRVHATSTAFPHREAAFSLHILAGWSEEGQDESAIQWARDFREAMSPHANGGVYVNLLAEDEDDRVKDAYGPNYSNLCALKRKWDPDNLFRRNQNIPPNHR